LDIGAGAEVYTDDVISRVRDSVDIVDLVSGYVSLKKRGKSWLGLCPFHSEKTPSFNVNPDKQIFHCFGCGVGGDAFKFLELQKGLSFPEAIRDLADRAGITLPESRPRRENKQAQDERKMLLAALADAADHFRRELEGPAGSAARSYLANRGVSETIIQEFSLGWARPEWEQLFRHLRQKGHAPAIQEKAGLAVRRSEGEGYYDRFRGRIIFPIRDINGNVIAFGGRVMDDSQPKYLNSPETPLYSKSNILYGMDKAKEAARKNDHFIVVEGYLDAIACHQHGVRNAVATLGTALTDGHLRLMRRFTKKLKLIFDPDPAGVRAALRSFDLLVESGMNVKVVSLPGGDDPDTVLVKRGREAFAASLKEAVPLMDFVLGQVVKDGAKVAIEEKSERVQVLKGYLAKIPSEIEKGLYIKKSAEALGVDESDLRREITKYVSPTWSRTEKVLPTTQHKKQHPRVEEMLIHLLLRDENLARKGSKELVPEDFTDSLYRRAFKRIVDVVAREEKLDLRKLSEGSDEELCELFSSYAVLELECEKQDEQANVEVEKEKAFVDCVSLVKQIDPEAKFRQITKLIEEAEKMGDVQEQRRLLAIQVELCRRPGRQIPGLK
jgi:DNA primase